MAAIINNYNGLRIPLSVLLGKWLLEETERIIGATLPPVEEIRKTTFHKRTIFNRSRISIPKDAIPMFIDKNGNFDQSQFYKGAGI